VLGALGIQVDGADEDRRRSATEGGQMAATTGVVLTAAAN